MRLTRKQLHKLERELADPIRYMKPQDFAQEYAQVKQTAWIIMGLAGLVLVVISTSKLTHIAAYIGASLLFMLGLFLFLTVRQWIARERRYHLLHKYPQLKQLPVKHRRH